MKDKIIAAALTEMEIHSLRFTMEDLTRRLHIGRNSLYKVVSSKDALIKSVIEYKTMHFAERAEKILSGADDTDTKIKKSCNCTPTPSGQWATTSGATCKACTPTFGTVGKIFTGARFTR